MGGRMKPAELERLLNENAGEGWALDRILDGEGYASLAIGKDVFYVIFRRETHVPPRWQVAIRLHRVPFSWHLRK